MRIQPEHGNSRPRNAERAAQMRRQQTNRVEHVALCQCSRHFCKSNMCSHQRHRQLTAREHHAPQPGPRHLREQFRMAGKVMPRTVHPVLANRRRHQSVDFAAHRHPGTSYNVIISGAAALNRRMSGANCAR